MSVEATSSFEDSAFCLKLFYLVSEPTLVSAEEDLRALLLTSASSQLLQHYLIAAGQRADRRMHKCQECLPLKTQNVESFQTQALIKHNVEHQLLC